MTDRLAADQFALDRFPAGSVSQCWVRLFELAGFGPVEIPVIVARGRTAGPLLFAVAGIHGNEYEGMAAIRQVTAELDPNALHGTFAAIVTANPFAYASRTRESPAALDGRNLARVFPGSASGSPTERLAAALFQLIRRTVRMDDLLLDLHSGPAEVAFATMAGYRVGSGPARAHSEEAARHMGLPLLWEIPDSPGPLNAETSRIGIPTIGTETTGRAGCRVEDVAHYRQGLRNLLAWMGICPEWEPPLRDDRKPQSTIALVAPATGFLRVEVGLLGEVAAGERIGRVIDPFGALVAEVRSPVSGAIWAVRETPHVDAGDLIFMIAER
jgi:predicted deacylase